MAPVFSTKGTLIRQTHSRAVGCASRQAGFVVKLRSQSGNPSQARARELSRRTIRDLWVADFYATAGPEEGQGT